MELHYHNEFEPLPAQKINQGSKNTSCIYLLFLQNQQVQFEWKVSVSGVAELSCEVLFYRLTREMTQRIQLLGW